MPADPRARRGRRPPLQLHRVSEPDLERQVRAVLRMLGADPDDYPPGPAPRDPSTKDRPKDAPDAR